MNYRYLVIYRELMTVHGIWVPQWEHRHIVVNVGERVMNDSQVRELLYQASGPRRKELVNLVYLGQT